MGNSYKEALERARQAIGNDAYTKEDALAYAFPELGESEDERIRKELLAVINDLVLPDDQKERFNAYLEKQKGRAEWNEDDEEHINSLLARLEGMCKKEATFTQTRFAVSEDIDWLKSISERFVLQPKAEWSEEDRDRVAQYLHDRNEKMLWPEAEKITSDILNILRPPASLEAQRGADGDSWKI